MYTEKNVLTQFLSGDDQAYTWIYNAYAPELFSYGKSLGFEKNILKDAIQNIFFKLLCNRKLLADVKNLKFYLFRALKNQLLNMQRGKIFPVNHNKQEEPSFSIKITILDQLIEEEEKNELKKRIEKLLNCLTERQREAVLLRFLHELEYEEIASILNMTQPAVRNLIARAIKRMRTDEIYLLLFCYLLTSQG